MRDICLEKVPERLRHGGSLSDLMMAKGMLERCGAMDAFDRMTNGEGEGALAYMVMRYGAALGELSLMRPEVVGFILAAVNARGARVIKAVPADKLDEFRTELRGASTLLALLGMVHGWPESTDCGVKINGKCIEFVEEVSHA